jgi:parallel beta-helix repeat protein
MRQPFILCSSVLLAVAVPRTALAATWYVSPTGTATSAAACATRATPCTLASSASGALAGDTVVLMDGLYKTSLYVTATGTSAAWLTYKADECATPILEGAGPGPMADNESSGVGSADAQYVRFQGIVVRGFNIGFGNGWAGGVDSDELSNGHWEIENCISYSNGRTGFTFFSAEGFSLKNSISAHNGSSQVHAWSSGVTLFEASGSSNKVEGTISFENTDAERHTDGSGFIVDEESNGSTFINNIAFGNAGSCFRLTRSSGTKFINNTCYHNSQFGSKATGPTNPGEIYFTNGGVTQQNVSFMNNVIVGTGQAPAGATPIQNQPTSGWSNNVVTTGAVTLFADPGGTNPNFTPAAGATDLLGKGASGAGVPTNDIGFDPKCLVKRTPVMVGSVAAESWWQYDVDIDYIKSIGGVAKCFNGGARPANDIGSYKMGAVTTVAAGSCKPPVDGGGGAGGSAAGGAASMGGTSATAGTTSTGGVSAGGTDGTVGGSGSMTAGNGSSSGGSAPNSSGGSVGDGTGNSANAASGAAADAAGCGCRLVSEGGGSRPLRGLGLLGLTRLGPARVQTSTLRAVNFYLRRVIRIAALGNSNRSVA